MYLLRRMSYGATCYGENVCECLLPAYFIMFYYETCKGEKPILSDPE